MDITTLLKDEKNTLEMVSMPTKLLSGPPGKTTAERDTPGSTKRNTESLK